MLELGDLIYFPAVEPIPQTTTLDPAILNSIKDKMAQAFLMSLNSAVNYGLGEPGRDHDGLGIDYVASNATIGLGRRATLPINQMNIQLKGVGIDSISKLEITDTHIKYKLKDKLSPIARHFLFVVVLPEKTKLEEWCIIEPERIILNARGYYFKIDQPLTGVVKIPIENKLTPETYKKLFEVPLPVEFTL